MQYAQILRGVQQLAVNADYTGLIYDDNLYYYKIDRDKDDVYDYAVITDCNEEATSVEIPSEINGLPVTRIGSYAFSSCENLTSVSIPDTVTVLEGNSFSGTGLSEINLPDSIIEIGGYAFNHNDNLEIITIPDSVKLIDSGAFSACPILKTINIGKNVETIGDNAFANCKSLSKITIPDNVKSIGVDAFNGTPLLDNQTGVKYVDTWAVGCDKNYDAIEIKDGTKGIARRAFMEYDVLETVTFPDSLEIIDEHAFVDCPNIKNISTGDGVKKICEYAFSDCTALNTFIMGESVETIENNVFCGCTKLENITIPKSAKNIVGTAFSDTPWLTVKQAENPYVVINSILIDATTVPFTESFSETSEITIPENVTTIGSYAFETARKGNVNVILPEYVTKIEHNGFNNFAALNDITIENPNCEIIDNGYKLGIQPDEYGVPAFEIDYGGTICFSSLWGVIFYIGTIYGYEGSTAQAYAEKCGYKFEVLDKEPVTTEPVVTTSASESTTTTTTTTITTKTSTTSASKTSTVTAVSSTSTVKQTSATTIKTSASPAQTTTVTSSTGATVILGDANGDGVVNVRDCAFIASALAKGLADTLPKSADFNGDGKINVRDAAAIASYLASGAKS